MPAHVHKTRNPELIPGVRRYSRSASRSASGSWAKKADQWKKPVKTETKPQSKKVPFGKSTRTVGPKAARFYPSEDIPTPLPNRKARTLKKTTLRSAITPGTVLILLAGRFRGKRVVFLKQLPSGLLLITGPYKVNGVPLRRVNQAYVIATSTKVDVSGLQIPEKINDAYFAKPKSAKKQKTESEFFAPEAEKKQLAPGKKDDQKAVDKSLLAAIKKTPNLGDYLNAKFSLKDGQYPHDIKF